MHTSLTDDNIRRAAITLIARAGYEPMSIRQLADEAGVNSSTLYLYYKGKRELLLTLVLNYLEDLASDWERCRPQKAKADVTLQAFVAFHVRRHLLKREEALMGNTEFRSLDASELASVRQVRRIYLAKLQAILEQGAGEGSLHCAEPKLLARIIFNMLTHACVWYQADGRLSIDEVVSHYSELVLRMLGASLPRRSRRTARQQPCKESS